MRLARITAMTLGFLFGAMIGDAQSWSTFLDSSRAIDWSSAGFSIPNYTVNCSNQPTLTAGSSNAATNAAHIQTSIASCDATHNVVNLPSGTYYIAGVDFQSKSNVVVRGAGANSTFLISTAESSCAGLNHGICMGDPNGGYNRSDWTQPGGSQACQWTAGYAKGTTTITLNACGSAPPLNKMLILDQKDDTSNTGGVYICSATTTGCTFEDNQYGRNIGGIDYSQTHVVYTTSVTSLGGGSYSVGISQPITANNIISSKNPGAWWSGFAQLQGLENVSIDGSADPDGTVQMFNCYQCWVKGVRILNSGVNAVSLYQSLQDVVRDSYFYGAQGDGSQSYGVEGEVTTGTLVENNIFQQVTAQIMHGEWDANVLSYNFAVNSAFSGPTGTYAQTSYTGHSPGNQMTLWEGNNFLGIWTDPVHGSTSTTTMFRNMLQGYQAGKFKNPGIIAARTWHRGFNVIGNVLGQPGYTDTYETYATSSTSGVNANKVNTAIYELGWTDYGFDSTSNCDTAAGTSVVCDPLVRSTMMRWGNWDVVNNAAQWVATEAAPGAVPYLNANFSSSYFSTLAHTLPASLVYSSTPSWWPSGKAWPPVGPDVSTGNVGRCAGGTYSGSQALNSTQCPSSTLTASWASHVVSIPAMDCYLNNMNGPANGSGSALAFDASTCYSAASTVSLTVTATHGTITGPNCSTGNYVSGTTVGPCTFTPSTGYSFTSGWSATGSASCTGTGTCASFSLTSTTTLSASGTANNYTLSTATAGTGTGTVTCTPAAGSVAFGTSVSCAIAAGGGSSTTTVSGCGGTWSSSPYTFSMPAGNCTVTATFAGTAATPTFSPVAGSYGPTQNVTISTTTTGATICYTTNGSTPASSSPGVCAAGSTQYVSPVSVATSLTLKAIATKTGFTNSAVGSAAYTINGAVAAPTFSPVAGLYTSTQNVTISTTTSGASCFYTTDGSTPTPSSTPYTTPVAISSTTTLKSVCTKTGFSTSAVASGTYTIATGCSIGFSPAAGTYSGTQSVTISTSGCPSGTQVFYRTDGLPATNIDTQYSTPVSVSSSQTITAKAVVNPTVRNQPQTLSTQKKCNAVGSPITFPSGYSCNNGSGGVAGTASDFKFTPGTSNQIYVTTTDAVAYDTSVLLIDTPTATDNNIVDQSFRKVYQDSSNCSQTSPNLYKCVDVSETDAESCCDATTHALWQMSVRCSTNVSGSSGNNGFLEGDASSGNEKWNIPCVIGTATDLTVNSHWALGDTGCGGSGCMVLDSIYLNGTEYDFPASCDVSDTNCPSYPMTPQPTYSNFIGGSQDQVYARNVGVAGTSPLTTTRNISFGRVGVDEGSVGTGSAAYVITAASPTFSPVAGTYASTQSVTLSSTLTGATICYTTDGSTPTANGAGTCTHGTTYSTSVSVSSSLTIKAISSKSGYADSSVSSAAYTINGQAGTPTFSPVAGTYTSAQSVTISTSTTGATLCYTLDGSTPTADGIGHCTHGTTYSTAVTVPSSLTLKAIASKNLWTDSAVGSAAYVITPTGGPSLTISGSVTITGTVTVP